MRPPRAASTSGGSPLAVMRAAVSALSSRAPLNVPPSSSIWPKRRKSGTLDTSPTAPSSSAGLVGERHRLDLDRHEAAAGRRSVDRGEAGGAFALHEEHRVAHAERLEDPAREEAVERLARPDLDQPAEHRRRLAVAEARVRILHERRRA